MTMRSDFHASDFAAVTPGDTTAVDFVALYVGGAGNLAVKGEGGVAVTFTAVPVGTVLYGHFLAVMATNTTASNIVGFRA